LQAVSRPAETAGLAQVWTRNSCTFIRVFSISAFLPKADIEKTLMNVQLFLVQTCARPAVSAGLETACKFAEEAEPLTQMQVHMQKVTLHQIGISRRAASQIWMAEIFATIPCEDAQREVIVLVVTSKRDKLQAVQELSPAIRIAEIPVVFVIRQLRKGRGWAGATRLHGSRGVRGIRGFRRLRRSRSTRDQHK